MFGTPPPRRMLVISLATLICLALVLPVSAQNPIQLLAANPDPPTEPVKLIFVHHSCGENWLNDGNGGLGIALRDANYFVSDTNYGWGTDDIGSSTDIGHWYTWFQGANSSTYTAELYAESGQHSSYSRLASDPGGSNEIIMFKSCYPNSDLGGSPSDPPTTGANPLRDQSCGSSDHTVANAKGIYVDLLTYFGAHTDKLFVVISAPPLQSSSHGANARALNNWLVDDWLDGYAHHNVAVFDFYNVLTSNGGDTSTNDLGSATGNHHRWRNGAIEHMHTVSNDLSAYAPGDSHPSAAGNQKASAEFVPLLNVAYHAWKDGDAGNQDVWSVVLPWVMSYGPAAGGWTDFDTFPRCLGDVNGDGLDDIVGFGNRATYVSLSTGSAFWSPSPWIASYGPAAGGWTDFGTFPRCLGDVNGDGLDDIVGFGNRATYVSLSTGNAFQSPHSWIADMGLAAGWTDFGTFPRCLGDVDGDGKDDIVGFYSQVVYVAYSTGQAFQAPVAGIAAYGNESGGWTSQNTFPRGVADLNNDGRYDLVGFGNRATYASLAQ